MDGHPGLVLRDLFGGALRLRLPADWLDTEAFMDLVNRPVPDNQEIFVAPLAAAPTTSSGGGGADEAAGGKPLTLFVDVLEAAVGECPMAAALPRFHCLELLKRDERPEEAAEIEAAPELLPSPLPPPLLSDARAQASAAACADTGAGAAREGAAREGSSGEAMPLALALPPVAVALRSGAARGGGCMAGAVAFAQAFPRFSFEVCVVRLPAPHSADLVFSLHGRALGASTSGGDGPGSDSNGSGAAAREVAAAAAAGPSGGIAEEQRKLEATAVGSSSVSSGGSGGGSGDCPPLAQLVGSLEVVDWGLFGGGDDDGGDGGGGDGGEGEGDGGGQFGGMPRYLGS